MVAHASLCTPYGLSVLPIKVIWPTAKKASRAKAVQPGMRKYFARDCPKSNLQFSLSRTHKRGGSRSSRTLERDRWTHIAGHNCCATSGVCGGRRNRVVLALQCRR